MGRNDIDIEGLLRKLDNMQYRTTLRGLKGGFTGGWIYAIEEIRKWLNGEL